MASDTTSRSISEHRWTIRLLLISISSGCMALIAIGMRLLLDASFALDDHPHLDSILSVGSILLLLTAIPAGVIDVILLFQASGPWNLCGGEELFEKECRARSISGVGVLFRDKGFGVYSSWSGTVELPNCKGPVTRSLRWSP